MSIRHVPAPWLKEGERDRWISVNQFAQLVKRRPKTIYWWLSTGDVLPKFGYRAFRDAGGQWRIQVPRSYLAHL
ncbi:MAG TPA: hypothetical protein VKP67_19445 [Xanthobacteraceae bacterium]|nr:hypothetical protein [Xanthobacteraceae bacterium]